ncbi:MAG: hypothetical protein ACI8XB_001895 [Patiriisocius sp.]|jgi:hypothetical protein
MISRHLLSIISTLILLCAIIYFAPKFSELSLPNFSYIAITVFAAMSYLFGEWIVGALNERPALYVNRYMIGFMVKMFSFLAIIGTYLYLNPENKFQVALSLFACYLIFNIHMIVFLKKSEKNFKAQNTPSKKSNL